MPNRRPTVAAWVWTVGGRWTYNLPESSDFNNAHRETGGGWYMLHIHNGDSTANTLKEFGFPGEHVAFQEVLMEGPTPGNLSPEEWVRIRATFLAESYELKFEDSEKGLLTQ